MEVVGKSETPQIMSKQEKLHKENENSNDVKKMKMKKRIGKWVCFRSDHDHPTVESFDGDGNFDMESAYVTAAGQLQHKPTHIVVMVNGIIGSATDWRFAAKQFVKTYPQDLIVHCSKRNSSTLTLDGVDVMGSRLAEEVMSVISRYPDLRKISFIGHSLGGLIARFAIAKLYEDCSKESCQEDEKSGFDGSPHPQHKLKGKIAGLEPLNFITLATPHLGTRGHKQVPLFCGSYGMEKLASRLSWILMRTGRHLFLTDADNGKPPLLLQMVNDSEELKFISALRCFKRRVLYANAHFDHIVGWSTSSIRRRNELPKRKNLSRSDKYPHILKVEVAKSFNIQQEKSVEGLEMQVNRHKAADMEEAMIRGLNKVSWERIDVSFKGSKQRYFAHNTILVRSSWINSAGADVIQHMVDNFLL